MWSLQAGKMHADPFPSSSTRAFRPLQLVHSDVHGPVKVSTHQGYCYWVSFIDDFSCFRAVYLLKRKSETFAAFKQLKAWAENGGEYMSREFEAFCIDYGIQRQHIVRNRPQQNGVAESANKTIEEGIISMLHESGLPPSFWGEAISSYIHGQHQNKQWMAQVSQKAGKWSCSPLCPADSAKHPCEQ